jgi:hypothetical protein
VILNLSGVPTLFAQSFSDPQFGARVLFDRADRASDLSEWTNIAEDGFSELSESEQVNFEALLEDRLLRFSQDNFQQQMEKVNIALLLERLAEVNKHLLYQTDENGAILYDESGDPVMFDIENYDEDQEDWDEEAAAVVAAALASWQEDATFLGDEMAGLVSGRYKAIVDEALTTSLGEYKKSAQKELESLVGKRRTSFAALRKQDTYSLRRKQEEESAGALAETLIGDTEKELEASRRGLLDGLEKVTEAPATEISLRMQDWEESFKEEFEKALGRWDDAESRFLEERIRWELDAQDRLVSAEESWDKAFTEFASARSRWAEEISAVIEEGRSLWEEKQASFSSEFNDAVAGLEASASGELEKFKAEIDQALSTFRSTIGLQSMAEQYLEYYESRMDDVDVYREELRPALDKAEEAYTNYFLPAQSLRDKSLRLKEYFDGGAALPSASARDEDLDWYVDVIERAGESLFRSFGFSKNEAERMWVCSIGETGVTFSIKKFFSGDTTTKTLSHKELAGKLCAVYQASYKNNMHREAEYQKQYELYHARDAEDEDYQREIDAWKGILETALSAREGAEAHLYDLEDYASGYGSDRGEYSVAGDSYEAELARLSRRVSYLQGQLAVSEAVIAYVHEESSLRPTEAETAAELEASAERLEEARNGYNAAQEAVQGLMAEMERLQEEMDQMSETVITPAEEALSEARELFENAWSVYTANDTALLTSVINDMEHEISSYYLENGRFDLYLDYFTAAELWNRNNEEEEQRSLLDELDASSHELEESLASLEEFHVNWEAWDGSLFTAALADAGFQFPEEKRSELSALFYAGKNSGGEGQLARACLEEELASYQKAIASQLAYKQAAGTILEIENFDAWGDEAGWLAWLRDDAETAENGYLAAKASLLRDALRYSDGEGDERSALLSSYLKTLYPDEAERADLADAYDDFAEGLSLVADGSVSREEAVEGIDPALLELFHDFVDNGGIAVKNGYDLSNPFLKDELSRLQDKRALVSAADEYGAQMIPVADAHRNSMQTELLALFPFDREEEPYLSDSDDLVLLLSDMYKAGEIPDYFEDRVLYYLASVAARDEIDLSGAEELLASADSGLSAALEAMQNTSPESYQDLAKLTSLAASLELEGSEELLLLASAAVVEDATALGQDAGESLSAYLLLCGFPSDALSLDDVLAFDPDSYLCDPEEGYWAYRDGDYRTAAEAASGTDNPFLFGLTAALLDRNGEDLSLSELAFETASWYRQAIDGDITDYYSSALASYKAASALAELEGIVIEGDDPFREAQAGYDLLSSAFTVMNGESSEEEGESDYAAAAAAVESKRRSIADAEEDLVDLKTQLEHQREEKLAYLRDVVTPRQEALSMAQAAYDESRATYGLLLDEYQGLAASYGEKSLSVDDAYSAFCQARLEYQTANEIYGYASGGYDLLDSGPQVLYQSRQKEYEDAHELLALMEGLEIEDSSFSDTLDPNYLAKRDEIKGLQEQISYLLDAYSTMEEKVARTNILIGNAYTENLEAAFDLFDFPYGADGFIIDYDASSDQLSDFTQVENGDILSSVEAYFDGEDEDIARKFSRDITLWLRALNENEDPEALMRQFGRAFFYEFSEAKEDGKYLVDVSVMGGSAFKTLVDDYVHFRRTVSVPSPLGDGDTEIVVSIDGRQWLKDKSASSYVTVFSGDEEMQRLYAFYKTMLRGGKMRPAVSDAIDHELSYQISSYVDKKAKKRQKKYSKWYRPFKRKEGRRIKDLRKALPSYSAQRGKSRLLIADTLERASSSYDQYDSEKEYLNQLLGNKGGTLAQSDQLIALIESETDRPLSDAQKEYLTIQFSKLSDGERSSNFTALEGVKEAMDGEIAGATQELGERVALLRSERSALLTEYTRLQSEDEKDWDAIEEVAVQLYQDPSFSEEDYFDAELSFSRGTESYDPSGAAEVLSAYGERLASFYEYRLGLASGLQLEKLYTEAEDLQRQELAWEEQTGELFQVGMAEWIDGYKELLGMRKRWQDEYERDYVEKATVWQEKYDRLVMLKNDWANEAADAAVRTGTLASARELGLDADAMIAEAEGLLVPDISLKAPDLEDVTARLVDGMTLGRVMGKAKSLTARLGTDSVLVAAMLPQMRGISGSLRELEAYGDELGQEVREHVAVAQAYQLRESVEKAEERIREQVASANRGLEKNLDKTMTVAGFRRKGSNYEREAIVDSTMWATETEKQRIGVYEYFEAPSFDYGVDLSGAAIKNSNTRILEAKVEKAKKRLDAYLGMLFGNEEEGEEGLDLDEGFLKLVEEAEASIRGSAQAEKGKETKGLFNIHVGYVPVMDKNKPEKVKEAGYGELGRIYEQFFIDEARFGRGIAVSGAPWYSQKLWDDDADNDGKSDGLLGAPTVKTIADIGMAVAASLVVPGGGVGLLMSVGLNLVDDALFTMADVSNGVDAGDAWGSFAKKGLTSVASAGINMGSGVLDGVIGSTGMMEVGSDVMLAGAQSAANTYSSAFINSLDFDNFGNSGWIDGGSFAHATSWGTSGSGYLSSMGGSLVSSGLMEGVSGNDNLFGFSSAHIGDVNQFSQTLGGLTNTAIEYGMTGSGTLNVAKVMGTGALELHLGGEGSLFQLGMEGTDVSLGTLSKGLSGLDVLYQNHRIKKYNEGKEEDMSIALRSLYSYGDEAGVKTYKNVLKGTDRLHIGVEGEEKAQTVANGKGGRDIYLAGNGGSKEEQLLAGVLLQHEAYRDGVVGSELEQVEETEAAVIGHTLMADRMRYDYGYGAFVGTEIMGDLAALYGGGEAGISGRAGGYDSSADYWKLTADGELEYDGDGWLKDESGKFLRDKDGKRIGAKGIETGLLNILNGGTSNVAYDSYSDEQILLAQKLMYGSGMMSTSGSIRNLKWDGLVTSTNMGKTLEMYNVMSQFGGTIASEVFASYYYDEASKAVGGVLKGSYGGTITSTPRELSGVGVDRYRTLMGVMNDFYEGGLGQAESLAANYRESLAYGISDISVHAGLHKGNDFAMAEGTHIGAIFSGMISSIDRVDNYDKVRGTDSSGKDVRMRLGFKFEDTFIDTGVDANAFHFSDIRDTLSSGLFVDSGYYLGDAGSTGASTGSHLHQEFTLRHYLGNPTTEVKNPYRERQKALLDLIGAPGLGQVTGDIDSWTEEQNYWYDDSRYLYYINANNLYGRGQ